MLFAASSAVKSDPVAGAYPDWQGISEKSYITGRRICPSDLRHKVTIVLEIEPNAKLQEQLSMAALFMQKVDFPGWEIVNWETYEVSRNVIFAVSNRGGGKVKDHDAIIEVLKCKGANETVAALLSGYRTMACAMYDDLTFVGAPDTTGKRPFVYVMGPEGKEPLCQGELCSAMMKTSYVAIAKARKQIEDWEIRWRPFYGNVDEPKFFPQLGKVIAKGKPLEPVEKILLKDVVAKDPEKAKEAQVLYDAVCQTRSDLIMRILMEYGQCPHRAYYDLQKLLRFWPKEKKNLDPVLTKIKTNPGAMKLAQMFCKLMVWMDPEFTCKNQGEAKSIVAALNKMKVDLEKLKEQKGKEVDVVVQNGALILDSQVDELISTMPTRVSLK